MKSTASYEPNLAHDPIGGVLRGFLNQRTIWSQPVTTTISNVFDNSLIDHFDSIATTTMDAFTLLAPDVLHCENCRADLGTVRADGSVLVAHRGVTVVVHQGWVVCGVCGHTVYLLGAAPPVKSRLDFELPVVVQ